LHAKSSGTPRQPRAYQTGVGTNSSDFRTIHEACRGKIDVDDSNNITQMTSDDSQQVGGPLQRCRCDYPQPPDADLITVAAAVDSAAEAEAQRKRRQRQRRRDAEAEAAPEKSFWKRYTTTFVTDCAAHVRRGAARLCPNCCGRWTILFVFNIILYPGINSTLLL